MHAVTISEKEAMNLEENMRHGSAWREEREGRNVPVNICEGQKWGMGVFPRRVIEVGNFT